jgi:hypothetical protein
MKLIYLLDSNDNNELSLEGVRGKGAKIEWKGRNLSRFFLCKIDQLLEKNHVKLDKISEYKIMSKVPENYTSYRIAKIALECLFLAKNRLG